MKIIGLGDIHGHNTWQNIVNNETFDKIVFVGDYFDSFDISPEKQLQNFLDILEFKKSNPENVILLIGNHDHHYFWDIGNCGTSGYKQQWAPAFGAVLEDNREFLQMAFQIDNVLFTHAGLSPLWASSVLGDDWESNMKGDYADLINEIWMHKPKAFIFTGIDSYGNDKYQTPIWIRPQALMYIAKPIHRKIIQVVGHTGQKQIDIEGKSTGGRYYFIDTLGTSKEYLIYENKTFKAKKHNNEDTSDTV